VSRRGASKCPRRGTSPQCGRGHPPPTKTTQKCSSYRVLYWHTVVDVVKRSVRCQRRQVDKALVMAIFENFPWPYLVNMWILMAIFEIFPKTNAHCKGRRPKSEVPPVQGVPHPTVLPTPIQAHQSRPTHTCIVWGHNQLSQLSLLDRGQGGIPGARFTLAECELCQGSWGITQSASRKSVVHQHLITVGPHLNSGFRGVLGAVRNT
jgi:hypothetical protein